MPSNEPKTSDVILSTRIINAREASGYSQSQLSLRMGVKKSTIANWEASRDQPEGQQIS